MNVGILGGGQLARMLALAGMPLGIEFHFIEQQATRCVANLGPLTVASFSDQQALHTFAQQVDVITFESENIPQATLEFLLGGPRVLPGITSLTVGQNRFNEKTLFEELEIPTVRFSRIKSFQDLQQVADTLHYPFIVKTITGGYDGKGQYRLHMADDLLQVPFSQNVVYLAESWMDFDYEVSCVAVRGVEGEISFYDLCLNTHQDGILRETCPLTQDVDVLTQQAHTYTQRIMESLGHIGVLTVEYFVKDKQLYANEIAPRVHNTGHWTIDAAVCSQFENHVRAICGLPLGDTRRLGPYKMTNIIGEWPTDRKALLAQPGLHLHDYLKEPRPGRKLGHITVMCDSANSLN